ncbi:pyrroloquinoline quinone biosynthesis protein PqqF [Erwinia sp. V71]|uniref:pyrroloquinoline quinone biosynthesis protein PqqF n=1 Tax=Erwinia sp. V71 TaxID=3369424 RepID=UPI003F5F1C35
MLSLTLANGLQVHLRHDPTASRAAALIQLDAGSHATPVEWPGLAHLLEHLVFAGGEQYQGDARLMAWAQRVEARLNATTDDHHCAWFFDAGSQQLEAGLARMVDMLAQPRLTEETIRQEVAVIDAEYQLLSRDSGTLTAAATRCAFRSPAAMQRFHTGSAARFGDDTGALQQALRDWHQQHFTGNRLTLWLQGPQSLAQLTHLAQQYGGCFASPLPRYEKPETLQLAHARHYSLCSAASPRLRLSFCLAKTGWQQRASLTLLRHFLTDEAPGSLLAELRARDYCESAEVQLLYCSSQGTVLSIDFLLSSAQQTLCGPVEALCLHWLHRLADAGLAQLTHYAALACQQFRVMAPVDQLRARAFGFPPPEQVDSNFYQPWQALLEQLTASNLTRLWISPLADAADYATQGFRLALTATPWRGGERPAAEPHWQFYPLSETLVAPELPQASCPLPHHRSEHEQSVLLLSPAPGYPLSEFWGEKLRNGLRGLVAECAHAGGSLSFAAEQGSWLLTLSAEPHLMLSVLDRLQQQIRVLAVAGHQQAVRQYQQHQQQWRAAIAVRALLQQLPLIINGDAQQPDSLWPQLPWCAALYGGDQALQQQLSQLLTLFPAPVNPSLQAVLPPVSAHKRYSVTVAGRDAAVLLFCPLSGQSASEHAAWRLLAAVFAPRFFQQLRIEQNLGYVVSCHFQAVAGVSGIVFAVQSPTHSTAAILQSVDAFIEGMADEIATLDEALFAQQRASLQASLLSEPAEPVARYRAQWRAQQDFAAPLTDAAIAQLSAGQLYHYYQQLRATRDNGWVIVSDQGSDIVSC